MARANVCSHPAGWVGSSYREITGRKKRYRIVNRERLKKCLAMPGKPDKDFNRWYNSTIDEILEDKYLVREPFWSESTAVGTKEWVENLFPESRKVKIRTVKTSEISNIAEDRSIYAAYLPKREKQAFWNSMSR
jgi:hypothetical protein